MNLGAQAAAASDGEALALHRFLEEGHEELCQDLAQEKVADLLEWLKTREVLNAVECEMIISSGPPQYQADTMLRILSARDAREHWMALWNGLGKCAPLVHSKWYSTISTKLGEMGLTGLALPRKPHSMSLSRSSYKKHSTSERSAGRSTGNATQIVSSTDNAPQQSYPAKSDPGKDELSEIHQQIDQLTLERNAARAERVQALADVETATASHYDLQRQLASLQYNTDPLKAELHALKERLEKKNSELDEALEQKELFREQWRMAVEESQKVNNMLMGMQQSHQEANEQLRKKLGFYEMEVERGRSSLEVHLQDYAHQRVMLAKSEQELAEHREAVVRLKQELDRSISYEVKGGRLQIRTAATAVGDGLAVADPRNGGSGISHSGAGIQPCEVDICLNVRDYDPGILFQPGVFVRGIAPDGSAAIDGRLAVGDQLLEINGVATSKMDTINDMIRGCRRQLNLVVARHLLVPKSLQMGLAPPGNSMTGSGGRSGGGPMTGSIGSPAAMVPDGQFFDRGSTGGSSMDHVSLCSRLSGMSVQSHHSVQNTSLPNYYRSANGQAQQQQPQPGQPGQAQVMSDGHLAFLTGPMVAQLAGNRSFSPHTTLSRGGLSAGSPQPIHRLLSAGPSPGSIPSAAQHRPPIRHYSACDSRRTDILTQPKLLNLEDARSPPPQHGLDGSHGQHLPHFTSVPDLGPQNSVHARRQRQRYGTSTGVPARGLETLRDLQSSATHGSTDSLPTNWSRANTITASQQSSGANSAHGAPFSTATGAAVMARSGRISPASIESSSSSDSASSRTARKPAAATYPQPPLSRSSTSASMAVGGKLPEMAFSRTISVPQIELLSSHNGGRHTTPMRPEIIISGANVGQREITPMKLRAPLEVRNKLHLGSEPHSSVPITTAREVITDRRSEEATLDEFVICGGRGYGVFVASLPNWMADEGLVAGDRFVYIGGEDVQNATYEHCHFMVHCSLVYGSSLAFVVEYDPAGLRKLPLGPNTRDNFFVRCEFNYANIDAGELEICRGDILNVVNTMHDERTDSWFAYKMKGLHKTNQCGVVPSRNRASALVIRRRSSQISRDVDMDEAMQVFRGASPKPVSRRGSARSNFKLKNLFKRLPSGEAALDFNNAPLPTIGPMSVRDNLPTGYTNVKLVAFTKPRPVILLGVMAEEIAERLLQAYPQTFFPPKHENFSSSQAVKAGLANRTILQCQPALDQGSNPPSGYRCITKQAVEGTETTQTLHCLLGPQPACIDLLEQVKIFPIVLFLQPKSEKKLRLLAMQMANPDVSAATAKDLYDGAHDDLSRYRSRVTSVIEVGTLIDRALYKIVNKVQHCQEDQNFIPVHETG